MPQGCAHSLKTATPVSIVAEGITFKTAYAQGLHGSDSDGASVLSRRNEFRLPPNNKLSTTAI